MKEKETSERHNQALVYVKESVPYWFDVYQLDVEQVLENAWLFYGAALKRYK